ncbi:MAG TPA: hypothetical protein VE954_24085 [Oligoflexus sp.]|uniref:hypothetical protein n=1 Tax=Oligoflexus sp. TaxID=1971216 RepID=UPI002D2C1E20|nr:hypothetical protein [Oligoflexus sp.]HYX36194.1 hypothetical protein [Oligoflexus sp.]
MIEFAKLLAWQINRYGLRDLGIVMLYLAITMTNLQNLDFMPAFIGDDVWSITKQYDRYSHLIQTVVSYGVLLFVYGRLFSWPLEHRKFLASHPISVRTLFLVQIVHSCILSLAIESSTILEKVCSYVLTVNSSNRQFVDFPSLDLGHILLEYGFVIGLSAFASALRPFHYIVVFLVALAIEYSDDFIAFDRFDFIDIAGKDWMLFLFGILLGLAALYLFERHFNPQLGSKRGFFAKIARRISGSILYQMLAVLCIVGPVLGYIQYNQKEVKSAIEKIQSAQEELLGSLLKRRSLSTQYFEFKFDEKHQDVFDLIKDEADPIYLDLLHDFNLKPEEKRIPVFIREAEVHLLGSTMGNHITLNVSKDALRNKEVIARTFRHESIHVLINRLTQDQLSRPDVFAGFLHEGLAEFGESNWKAPDETLWNSVAVTRVLSGMSLHEFLNNISWFAPYSYALNYDFGHLFWYEMEQEFGRKALAKFLKAIGLHENSDTMTSHEYFIYQKGFDAKLNLFMIVSRIEQELERRYKIIEASDVLLFDDLKNIVVHANQGDLIVPYEFQHAERLSCEFRKEEEVSALSVPAVLYEKLGKKGYRCKIPEGYYRVSIKFMHPKFRYQSVWFKY